MSAVPESAMVLAAGLGTRLRPLTRNRPKALIEVAGKALIDHALDRLAKAGVRRAVVNLHHLGDQVRSHLAQRRAPEIVFSDESAALLDTGGGIAKALPLLGAAPFLAVNCDALWLDGARDTLTLLARHWDGARMDALLLLQPSVTAIGYDGRGDYHMEPDGVLRRRRELEIAPFVFAGAQMLSPALFSDPPPAPFSVNRLYDRAQAAGRLYGQRHEGLWAHVGRPDAIPLAARMLTGA